MTCRALVSLVILALGILIAPPCADAQQPARVPRIGFLWPGSPGTTSHLMQEIQQGLRGNGETNLTRRAERGIRLKKVK